MSSQYVIWLSDQFGTRQRIIDGWLKLDFARTTNDVGALTLTLPPSFDMSLAPPDSRIEIWRTPDGGTPILETGTTWLVRGPLDKLIPDRGDRSQVIRAASAANLLRRRIVAYASGTAQSKKSTYADDMLKSIVSENLGSSATAARDLSAYLTIQSNISAAPSIAKEFAYANVLKACQDIAQASAQAGTRLYFDVVAPTPSTLEFRTYITQRGTDHGQTSQQPVTFAIEFGNLANVVLSKDYSNEQTYIYVGGQGTGSKRVTNYAEDTARSGRSVLGRREAFVNASSTTDPSAAALLPEARSALEQGRPRKRLKATLLEAPSTIYGKHFGFGDKVIVNVEGDIFDARIESIHVTVTEKREVLDIKVSSDDDL